MFILSGLKYSNISFSIKSKYFQISSFVLEKTKSEFINTFGVSIDIRRFSSHCDNVSDYLYNEVLSSSNKAKYFYVHACKLFSKAMK